MNILEKAKKTLEIDETKVNMPMHSIALSQAVLDFAEALKGSCKCLFSQRNGYRDKCEACKVLEKWEVNNG